jgi:hypothetical protein
MCVVILYDEDVRDILTFERRVRAAHTLLVMCTSLTLAHTMGAVAVFLSQPHRLLVVVDINPQEVWDRITSSTPMRGVSLYNVLVRLIKCDFRAGEAGGQVYA